MDSKPDQSLDKGVRAPNVLEGGKEETESPVHTEKQPTHSKETHGMRDDIDVNTPISDVKGPNVFERVKEEFEAIVETIHPNKEDKNQDSPSSVKRDDTTFTGSKDENQSSPAGKSCYRSLIQCMCFQDPKSEAPKSPVDELKPDQSLDKGVKAPNELENHKEETEALLHTEKQPTHNKETHGLRDDIDVNTPSGAVKGPNVFERVKEEFEAIVETIRRKEDKNQDSPSSAKRGDATFTGPEHENQSSPADHTVPPSKIKQENLEVKEETHKVKSPVIHHKETHGRGEDIDPDTPIGEFRGPSIFHRAKEEFEAIVDTIHSKKESDRDAASPKKEGGFRATISQKLHKIYTKSKNRD